MPGDKNRKQARKGSLKMGCCKGLLPHMTDFLQGDAGQAVCRRISKHLAGCKRCRMYVDTQAGIIGLYRTWRSGAAPEEVKVRLRQRLAQVMTDGSRR